MRRDKLHLLLGCRQIEPGCCDEQNPVRQTNARTGSEPGGVTSSSAAIIVSRFHQTKDTHGVPRSSPSLIPYS